MDQDVSVAKKKEGTEKAMQGDGNGVHTLSDHYHGQLDSLAPSIKALMEGATLVDGATVKSASDYSYTSSSYAGRRYRLVGDAAGERLTSYLIISFESHWHYYSVH
jgi:hypothetical protein